MTVEELVGRLKAHEERMKGRSESADRKQLLLASQNQKTRGGYFRDKSKISYYTSARLTEKSYVFSFGVVLVEMITGQPAILRNEDRTRITDWVDSTIKNSDIKQVIDPRFKGKYDVNIMWKAIELALVCASRNSSNSPTINVVVIELKECLAIVIGRHETDQNNSIGMVSMDFENSLAPKPK
ncbi:putative LRR receptor-like protein kinase At1g51890 [Apium graveolens]|uniref:putative LRR receptor-like protein kinase At1g51890 n=1 Tax=Apium graveolens TaxID=4045 RepID=UPI003D7B33F1